MAKAAARLATGDFGLPRREGLGGGRAGTCWRWMFSMWTASWMGPVSGGGLGLGARRGGASFCSLPGRFRAGAANGRFDEER